MSILAKRSPISATAQHLLWPPCVADADIIFSAVVSIFFFFCLISGVADWISAILLHIVCPIANLELRSEMCCTRLAGNTGRKNRQIFAVFAPSYNFVELYLRNISMYLKSEKYLPNSNISSTCSHNMVNFGPLAAENDWRVWATPANFNGFRVLASLLQRRRLTEVNQTLHDVWPSAGLAHYIYIFWFRVLLPSDRILPHTKFTLRPILAFSHIGSVTARHCSSGCQPNFAAWYKEWNYGTLQTAPPMFGSV